MCKHELCGNPNDHRKFCTSCYVHYDDWGRHVRMYAHNHHKKNDPQPGREG
jgi:hypothetical protein